MSIERHDRDAIIDLTIAYCWALDSRAWDELDLVFTPDATAELGRSLHGLKAIKRLVSDVLEPLEVSQHFVTNHQVHVEGDQARSRCYFLAQHVRTDGHDADQLVIAGRYEDELTRTDQGWRISRRRLVPLWRHGEPTVLAPIAR
jgi:ketosteroid isomerase-like protein